MRSLPNMQPTQVAYNDAQAQARALLTALTAHLDEHAATGAQYPNNLSYAHIKYIDEISAMLDTILCHTKGDN